MPIPTEWISFALSVAVFAVLASAAVSDIRRREVHDWHWLAIGVCGIAVWLAMSFDRGMKWEYAVIAAGFAVILFDILWDSDRSLYVSVLIYVTVFLSFLIPYVASSSDSWVIAGLMAGIFYAVYLLMYVFGLLRGGADAKCMISLTIAFPVYPSFFGLPLIEVPGGPLPVIFVFSLAVLFLALLFSLTAVIYFAYRNAGKTKMNRLALSGYIMDLDEAEKSHVWPMHDVENGELVKIPVPEETEEIYARLREHGEKEIWVTPMIPFILPILAATVFVALIGNPLFLI
ncbi:MAG: A24 family peptidase C-terminal domain-containing protein [Candidatus Methanomethylophilaceae archaeon]|jgi:preflagellin peptidase FlaK